MGLLQPFPASRDREFNSEGYPGFSYIGARLALSEDGYKKIVSNGGLK